ncbi:MAG: hypothetical protein P8Z41_11600 [Anaerolineales bacterium]
MMEEKRNSLSNHEDPSGQVQEPTVLDWVKSILRFNPIPIPEKVATADEKAMAPAHRPPLSPRETASRPVEMPAWSQLRFPLALILAVIAQFTIESIKTSPDCCSTRHYALIFISLHLFIVSAAILAFSLIRGDFRIEPLPAVRGTASVVAFRPMPLLFAVIFSMLTYLTSSEDTFRLSTVVFWSAAFVFPYPSLELLAARNGQRSCGETARCHGRSGRKNLDFLSPQHRKGGHAVLRGRGDGEVVRHRHFVHDVENRHGPRWFTYLALHLPVG